MKEIRLLKKLERARNKKKHDSHKLKNAEKFFPTTDTGLTAEQVEIRVRDGLINKKTDNSSKSYFRIVFENIFNFCNTVTILLVILLLAIGAWDYTLSSSIIFINIAIGIIQEIKAKWTVQKLSLVAQSKCDVVRDGKRVNINTADLVLEDVFYIHAGAQVPVDAVVQSGYIEVDESIISGESRPVRKEAGANILAGSNVHEGEACCIATRVGRDRYIEGVSKVAKRVSKPKSRIFSVLDSLIKGITVVLVILAGFLLAADRITVGGAWKDTVITVSSSVLGMIPIGMFLLTSTALAASVLKLSKKHALAQDLSGIEMLALTDTLLLDKTGTITDGKLELVETVKVGDIESPVDLLNTIMSATHDSKSTALALLQGVGEGEIMPVSDVMSFNSARKYSAVTLEGGATYVLGAPDFVGVLEGKVKEAVSNNSSKGRRSILLSRFDGSIADIDKTKTVPCFVFALEDTLRSNIRKTLDWFYENDVDIKIISGDDPVTVANIAGKAGLKNCDHSVNCAELDEESLRAVAADTAVFGRVSPEQKATIVKQLQSEGRTVGMIGDGVNDVQALKEADCSISFASANDVARNISRIILMDNDFASMPDIVKEGRQVIGNIEKVSALYIMKNIFVMFMTLLYAIITIVTKVNSYPFDTKKMLMIEFFVIGVPTFLFALQPTKARPKGNFLRNVLKSSLSAAVGLIAATGFIMIMNAAVIDYSPIASTPEAVEAVKAVMATFALTMAGFVCLTVISMPPNKFRLSVIAVMFVVSLLAIWFDNRFMDGTFLGMNFVPLEYAWWIIVSSVIALVAMLGTKWIITYFDNKYGEKIVEGMDEKIRDFKRKRIEKYNKRQEEKEEKSGQKE